MEIRHTRPEELNRLEEIYAGARAFMAAHGNPTQWGSGYPWRDMLEEDIALNRSYVCVEDGEVVGTFCYYVGEEPTYQTLLEGAWLDDAPYGVIHRLASDGTVRGITAACVDWCWQRHPNLRIDTHAANRTMQRAILQSGFTCIGRITAEDGTERLAYHRIK